MLAEATVVLLTLMVLSHLALQAHCFTARRSLPGVVATVEDRLRDLLKTADDRTSAVARSVDDGVDLLEELAANLGGAAEDQSQALGSPIASLLTGLLMPKTPLPVDYASTQQERPLSTNDDPATPLTAEDQPDGGA